MSKKIFILSVLIFLIGFGPLVFDFTKIEAAELPVDLPVNSFSNDLTGWTKTGISPYLEVVDYPSNYIQASTSGSTGYYGFKDASGLGTIIKVEASFHYKWSAAPGDNWSEFYLQNDGSNWIDLGADDSSTAWKWLTFDVTNKAGLAPWTLAKINNAITYMQFFKISGVSSIYIDAAKLTITYAPPNVSGWAWAGFPELEGGVLKAGSGWISFNVTNCADYDPGSNTYKSRGTPAGCPPAGTIIPAYGVNIDPATGYLSGYAWAGGSQDAAGNPLPTIGWISFNRADTGNPPKPPFNGGSGPIAQLGNVNASICDTNTNTFLDNVCGGKDNETTPIGNFKQVFGWARALAFGGGWDGWIKLSKDPSDGGPNYAVTIDFSSNPKEFRGWAWGSDVVGWISFNDSNTGSRIDFQVVYSTNQSPVAAMSCDPSLNTNCPGGACSSDSQWIAYSPTSDYPCIYTIINASTDQDSTNCPTPCNNDIVRSEWYTKIATDPDTAYSLKSSCDGVCNFTLPNIGTGDYIIKLYVKDSKGAENITTHSITIRKDAEAKFMCSLNNSDWSVCESLSGKIQKGETLHLKDDSSLGEGNYSSASDGATISSRTWEINGSEVSKDNDTNLSVTLPEFLNSIKLIIKDTNTRKDSETHVINTKLPLPIWKEIPPTF